MEFHIYRVKLRTIKIVILYPSKQNILYSVKSPLTWFSSPKLEIYLPNSSNHGGIESGTGFSAK
jgi:hypothetical protein